jgi:hypothetical protein
MGTKRVHNNDCVRKISLKALRNGSLPKVEAMLPSVELSTALVFALIFT